MVHILRGSDVDALARSVDVVTADISTNDDTNNIVWKINTNSDLAHVACRYLAYQKFQPT